MLWHVIKNYPNNFTRPIPYTPRLKTVKMCDFWSQLKPAVHQAKKLPSWILSANNLDLESHLHDMNLLTFFGCNVIDILCAHKVSVTLVTPLSEGAAPSSKSISGCGSARRADLKIIMSKQPKTTASQVQVFNSSFS